MAKRKKLPCYAARKDFLKLVKKHQTTVLVGETGSGKTTQCPQFLLEAGCAGQSAVAWSLEPFADGFPVLFRTSRPSIYCQNTFFLHSTYCQKMFSAPRTVSRCGMLLDNAEC